MPNYQAQEFLFQRIREILPPEDSLVDMIADILHVSSDSAYRRIRCETPLVLDEARQLCEHFKMSLDQTLNAEHDSTVFKNVRIDVRNYSYEQYLKELIFQVRYIKSFLHHEIIYCAKDLPIFHNFYYRPLIAFRYFFWMKTIIEHPDFTERNFELDCLPAEVEKLSYELNREYLKTPSIEIWNTECINALISQIEFYKDSGYFANPADVKTIYDAVEKTFMHVKHQAESGCKFLPGENPESKKRNFKFFYNRVVLGDNVIMVITDHVKTVYLNYDALNYITTRDDSFCNQCYNDLQTLMKKGTIISETSEKQRNIFFTIELHKIRDRINRLL